MNEKRTERVRKKRLRPGFVFRIVLGSNSEEELSNVFVFCVFDCEIDGESEISSSAIDSAQFSSGKVLLCRFEFV